MANNVFQVKRTSTTGRTPNTTGSYATNSQYIAAGEFALNMVDGVLYTSNGSALITVGANLVNQRITNSISIDNNKSLRFQTVNTSAYVGLRQQSDDNFVLYTTNTVYGERAVWSIFGNSVTSNISFSVPAHFNANIGIATGAALYANGGSGSAGQVLTSNGAAVYWSTVTATVSTSAQYTWSNLHTFQANVSFTGNGIGITTNTGAIYLGGLADNNWKIGRNTGSTTKWRYTNNSIDIITANSNLEGMSIGLINGNSYFETGYLGTFIASNVTIGNATVNVTINSTSFTGTASNASLLNNKTEDNLNVNNATTAYGKTEGNLNVNNATTAYGKTEGNLNVNNATTAYSKAESALNVNSALTANNSTNLGGQAASYYTNATNITTGTLPYAQIPANVINTTAAFTRTGITTFNANVVLGSSGLSANGGFGTAGQVLHSNGTATYWAADDNAGGTVTSVASGNGITGGTITTTGTLTAVAGAGVVVNTSGINVLANSGIVSNSTGVFVNAQSPLVANATGLHIATSAGNGTFSSGISAITVDSVGRVTSVTGSAGYVTSSGVTSVATGNGMTGGTITATGTVSILANTGVVANATGLFVNATYIGTLSANNTTYVNGKTEGNLNVNNALTSNNSSYLGGVQASQFMRTDAVSTHTTGKFTVYTPSGVVGTVSGTDNLEIFQPNAGSDAFLTFHISGDYAANFGIDGTTNDLFYGGWSAGANKYRVWHAGNDGTTSGLDADLLDGQHGSFYTNATNITTGTLPYAQIPANVINTTAAFTRTGVTTFSANVILGSSGLSANGGFGTAGHVLTTNGTATYWAAAAGGGYYKGGSAAVGTLAVGGQNLFRVNANTLNTSTTFVSGENGTATGPITIASGITLTIQTGARVSIV